jgi:hypothetical protein
VPLPWAYWHNLAGGTALQHCVKNGWTRYLALVFEKPADTQQGLETPAPE